MSPNSATTLGIEDLPAAVLHPRPTPYAGTLILVRVDDRRHGRRLVRRLIPPLPSAGVGPKRQSWGALALTSEGRRALGVPEESLATFPVEFREEMAARAERPLRARNRPRSRSRLPARPSHASRARLPGRSWRSHTRAS